MDELTAALAFERGLRTRAAQRTQEIDGGVVILHDELSRLHHLNALILDAPLAQNHDAEKVANLADQHLRHLPYRHVTVNDGPAAEQLWPDFASRGWTMERTVLMALRRAPDPPPNPQEATEVDRDEVRGLELEIDEQEEHSRGWPPGSAKLVSDGLDALRAGTTARSFAAVDNGRLAATCTLFLNGRAAMLDNVGTLEHYRGRGLGRAVVAAAVHAAREAGARPIVVAADADDWPQQLYVRIGFEPLGTQVCFTLWHVGAPR